MAYTYNKPDAADSISTSQAVLKDNFTAIKSFVDVNHITFGLTNEGKHNTVSMPQLTVSAGTVPIATSATEYALYTATDGSVPALWIRPPSQGAGTVSADINITSALKANPGWCRLPSGLLMQWGSSSGSGSSSSPVTVTYPKAFTATPLHASVSTYTAGSADSKAIAIVYSYSSLTTLSVLCVRRDEINDARSTSFTWLALGY